MPTAIPRWRTNHCDANEQMHQSKCERGRSQRRTDIADAKHQAAQHDRDHDAKVVAQPSHCDTAVLVNAAWIGLLTYGLVRLL
jgi:hypothetical protein